MAYDQRRRQKIAANKLKKILESPERRAQEAVFAAAHAQDSDEALYAYLVGLKQKSGDRMKAADVIGYCCLTERLGPWPLIMSCVNGMLGTEPAEEAAPMNEENN